MLHHSPPFTQNRLQAANAGAYKTQLPWWKIVLLGAVAGCYVGLGGALLLTGEGGGRGLPCARPALLGWVR